MAVQKEESEKRQTLTAEDGESFKMWFRKFLFLAISLSLCGRVMSATQNAQPPPTIEQQIRRIGTGNAALVELRLHDGRKLKGYVIEIRADEFALADAKTGRTSSIAFTQVHHLKHHQKRQLSPGARTAILVGITAGILTIAIVGYIVGQRPKNSGKTTFP